MDIQLLNSELHNITSIEDPLKVIYEKGSLISDIETIKDLEILIDLKMELNNIELNELLNCISVSKLEIQAKVSRSYTTVDELEDDFI